MLYKKFRIQNFKGIRNAEIVFDPNNVARVYSLVGLNESGKTTLLEAIHSFSPDADTQVVVGSASSVEQQRSKRVPKDKISYFTGDVSVEAELIVTADDKIKIANYLNDNGITVESEIPDSITYVRFQRYKDGEFKGSFRHCSYEPQVKTGKQKKFRKPDWEQETSGIWNFIESRFPIIAYFPTFIFDFPERIYLSRSNKGKINSFYKKLFQDILDYGDENFDISKHILDRIGKTEYKVEYFLFLPIYSQSDDKEKIGQVIDHASRSVTEVVFAKWNEIFGEKLSGKEISIDFNIEEAAKLKNEEGFEQPNTEHDLYINFYVKDGTKKFSIKDRSLGFRWFFSFLLFTQFRAARNDGRQILFLLDEPASNLHASAQQKLIESFPEITKSGHTLVYSTHSHYMINPNWLEQCFIVQNRADSADEDISKDAIRSDDSYDVVATPYSRFVNGNPSKTSYFQPVIDRLNVVPSNFDIDRGGIIVEGKSDYFILEYINRVHLSGSLALIPGMGSGNLDALISLHKGWGLPVRVLLDSDLAGIKEKARYEEKYLLKGNDIKLLSDFDNSLKEIESILNPEDKKKISKSLGKDIFRKKQALIFFQQQLAANKRFALTASFQKKAKALISGLSNW